MTRYGKVLKKIAYVFNHANCYIPRRLCSEALCEVVSAMHAKHWRISNYHLMIAISRLNKAIAILNDSNERGAQAAMRDLGRD